MSRLKFFKSVIGRLVAFSVLVASLAGGLIAASVIPAAASHFRAAQLTWSRAGSVVTFEFSESYRWNYAAWSSYVNHSATGTETNPQVGDVIQDATSMNFGDGAGLNPYLEVTSVDPANNVMTTEMVHAGASNVVDASNVGSLSDGVIHDYGTTTGSYLASASSCCRLGTSGGHMNNPDGSWTINSQVDLSQPASPISSLPPVIDCPKSARCTFAVPGAVPTGTVAVYRFANSSEAGGLIQPTGAAISTAGTYTWDTTGQTLAPAPLDTYYSTQVIIEAHQGSATGALVGSVAVDFFLRITNQTSTPPVWSAGTPADGSIVTAAPGQPVTIKVDASDPDPAEKLTMAVNNAPSGSTFVTNGPSNPVSGTFGWTPPAKGSAVVNFVVQNTEGVQSLPRSITINVTKQAPTLTWPTPAPIVYGTPLGSAQLNASVAPADAAANGTLAYTTDAGSGAAAGQVLHAGTHTLTATYTPAPTGLGLNYTSASTTARLVVNQAPQKITFSTIPALHVADPAVKLAATGGGSGNPVTYTAGPAATCTVSAGTLTVTGPGTCSVTAAQAGNADFVAATPVTQTLAVSYRDCLVFDPGAKFISGAVVPVRVTLCDAAGHNISSPSITLTGLTFDGKTPSAFPLIQPNNHFRYVPHLLLTQPYYEFDLATLLKASGKHTFTWSVQGDPTTHTATFTTL